MFISRIIWVAFLIFFILLIITTQISAGETYVVDDDNGDWVDFMSIQDAINSSNDQDIIRIYDGTFHETITINRTITLYGNGSQDTIVDSPGNYSAIEVLNESCIISHIMVINSRDLETGVTISADQCTVKDLMICDFYYGIYASDTDYHQMVNISIINCTNGLFLTYSDNINITFCLFEECQSGIREWFSRSYNILFNQFHSNWAGIYSRFGGSHVVNNNSFERNSYGFYLYDSDSNSIKSNFFNRSKSYGVYSDHRSSNNLFTLNEFHHSFNAPQAYDDSGGNNWDSGTVGNYWSDYTGSDNDNNSIGDEDYPLESNTDQVDRYPIFRSRTVETDTYYVDDDANIKWYNDTNFRSIHQAVENATDGMTIRVFDGVYSENVCSFYSLSFIGNGSDRVSINGSDDVETIKLLQDHSEIIGFNISHSHSFKAGIGIYANFIRIENNTFKWCYYGVYGDLQTDIDIINNIFIDNSHHLEFKSERNSTIISNRFINGKSYIRSNSGTVFVNNTFNGSNGNAIYFIEGGKNLVINNSFMNNWGGVGDNSNRNTYLGNLFVDNDWGIRLDGSTNSSLFNNTFINCSIYYSDSLIDRIINYTIPSNNTINGLPIYFLKNITSVSFNEETYCLLLANCSSILIENITFNNSTIPIISNTCDNLTIKDCYFQDVVLGILLQSSKDCVLLNNSFSGCDYSIQIKSSTNVTISSNELERAITGITTYHSKRIAIHNNLISNSSTSHFLHYSDSISIVAETFKNGSNGIVISKTENVSISNTSLNNFNGKSFEINGELDNITLFNVSFRNYSCANTSSFIIGEYIDLIVNQGNTRLEGVDIKINANNETIYATNFFGGSDKRTNTNGSVLPLGVPIRIYNGTNAPTNVSSSVVIHHQGFFEHRELDPINRYNEVFYIPSRVYNHVQDTSYYSLQSAIDEANTNDVIMVAGGFYNESLSITSPIMILGKGADTVIRGSNESEHVINITSDHVSISNISISPSDSSIDRGLFVAGANNCTFSNIDISGLFEGVRIGSSDNNTFRNISLRCINDGFMMSQSEGNLIELCNLKNNTFGINMSFLAEDNIVRNNSFLSNRYGFRISDSNNNTIYWNEFTNNTDFGISCEEGTQGNVISNNVFSAPNGTYLGHDNSGLNQWDNGTRGNLWANYTGKDPDGDGIGNSVYPIAGRGDSEDRYPLMMDIKIDLQFGLPLFSNGTEIWISDRTEIHLSTTWPDTIIYYRTYNDDDWTSWSAFSSNITLDNYGSHFVEYLGRSDGTNGSRFNDTVHVSLSRPSTNLMFKGIDEDVHYVNSSISQVKPFTISNLTKIELQSKDDGCGIQRTVYRLDNGSLTNYTVPFIHPDIEDINLTYNAYDNLGRPGQTRTVWFRIIPANLSFSRLYVDDNADPGWYDDLHLETIVSALELVEIDGTIQIFAGEYNETFHVDRSISLIGNGSNTTWITGITEDAVVNITADNVTFSGFRINGSADSALSISGDNVVLEDIVITGFEYAMAIEGSVNSTISNSTFDENSYGISMDDSDVTISNSSFNNNSIGVHVKDTGELVVTDCDLLSNGLDVSNNGSATVDAIYCYWGPTSGSTTLGLSSSITGNINYLPFRTEPVNSSSDNLSIFAATDQELSDFNGSLDSFVVESDCTVTIDNSTIFLRTDLDVKNGTVIFKNCTVVVNGTIIVNASSEYIIENSQDTLIVNDMVIHGTALWSNSRVLIRTRPWSKYDISVMPGGRLTIVDGCVVSSYHADSTFNMSVKRGATLSIQNSTVSRCGFDEIGRSSGIVVQAYDVTISHSLFDHCPNGITLDNASGVLVNNNSFSNCTVGLSITNGSVANSIIGNRFDDCVYGAYAWNNEDGSVNASHNWWGHSSGPFHPISNPDGSGVNVSDAIIFDPWLNARNDLVGEKPNVRPLVQIASPLHYQVVSGSIMIKGSAADPDGLIQYVQISLDDGPWTKVNGRSPWDYELDTTEYPNGDLNIKIRSFDGIEYSQESSIDIMINNRGDGSRDTDSEDRGIGIGPIFLVTSVICVMVLIMILHRRTQERINVIRSSKKKTDPVKRRKIK